ncbi:MAG: hypothetical protein RIS70_3588, partial [Planctomycetota bacterium]
MFVDIVELPCACVGASFYGPDAGC